MIFNVHSFVNSVRFSPREIEEKLTDGRRKFCELSEEIKWLELGWGGRRLSDRELANLKTALELIRNENYRMWQELEQMSMPRGD
ncbi:MAG TPA: hypothetical protein VIJ49_08320 [Aestuariivirga sp.]